MQNTPLYRARCVNWIGITKADTDDNGGEYYSEIIANAVLNEESLLTLPDGKLRDNFAFPNHNGMTSRVKSNRKEDRLCLDCYCKRNEQLTPFGKAINYQVNLIEHTKINIDLVAFDKQCNILWLIEVKGRDDDSPETLLRCALEIETYYRLLSEHKVDLLKTLSSTHEPVQTNMETQIKKGVWVPENSQAAHEYNNLKNYPNLSDLLEKWKIEVKTY